MTTDTHISRRTLALAGGLLSATLAIGALARVPALRDPLAPPPATRLDFAAPAGGPVALTGRLDRGAVTVGGDGLVRLELALRGRAPAQPGAAGLPTDLVVVLDRSSSMSGQKIETARAAIRGLVDELRPQDRFALVSYANGARLDVALQPAEPARRDALHAAVAGVFPRGGTNLSSGLDLALDTVERALAAGRAPRVVVISDGLANQGDTSRTGLRGRAARAAAAEYTLSTIGVGQDFDEALLAMLADAGTGNYFYLPDTARLAGVVRDELKSARETVASGVRVRIEPGAGVEVLDAGGYPLERAAGAVAFRPGALFAGQERRIWVTLRVPSDAPGERALGRFGVEYTAGGERHRAAFAHEPRVAAVADRDAFLAALDAKVWEQGAAVDGYNQMRQRVADAVRAGDRESALDEIRTYSSHYDALNAEVRSTLLDRQLGAARALESEVEGAFSAPEPMAAQNRLSKQLSAEGLDGRRVGAKR